MLINAFPAKAPFDSEGRFKAKRSLYTVAFHAKKIGGVTLETRFILARRAHGGAPVDGPVITDKDGTVTWQLTKETKTRTILPTQFERGP